MFDFFAVSGPNLLCLNRITWFLAIALILSSWDHSSDLDRLWPLSSSSSSSSSSTSTSSSHSSSMMVDGFFLNRFERFKRITFPSALAGLSSFLPGFPSGVRVCINFSSFYPQGYQQNTCFLCDFYRFNSIAFQCTGQTQIPSNINFTQANCIMNNCQPLTYGSRYPSIQSSQPQPQPPSSSSSSSFQNFKPIGSLFQHYQQQPINLQQHHHHHQNQQKQQQQQQQEKQQQHQQKR